MTMDDTETTIDHPMITVGGAVRGNPDAMILGAGTPITRTGDSGSVSR